MLYCSGWYLGTWAAPVGQEDLDWMQGTNHGTHGTCVFQAFILQFGGLATFLFNASLAVIYLLVIRYPYTWGKKNDEKQRVHKLEKRLQIGIWTVALVAAIVPLPMIMDMYHSAGPICWINVHPADGQEHAGQNQNELQYTILSAALQVLPILFCILCDSIIMIVIYRTIRSQEEEVQQQQRSSGVETAISSSRLHSDDPDDASSSSSSDDDDGDDDASNDSTVVAGPATARVQMKKHTSTSRMVAVQAMFYIAGFLLTFGFTALTFIIFFATGSWIPALDRASYFFLALQGLWNFLIFSRRRKMKTWIGEKARWIVWGVIPRLATCRDCRQLPHSGTTDLPMQESTTTQHVAAANNNNNNTPSPHCQPVGQQQPKYDWEPVGQQSNNDCQPMGQQPQPKRQQPNNDEDLDYCDEAPRGRHQGMFIGWNQDGPRPSQFLSDLGHSEMPTEFEHTGFYGAFLMERVRQPESYGEAVAVKPMRRESTRDEEGGCSLGSASIPYAIAQQTRPTRRFSNGEEPAVHPGRADERDIDV